MNNRKKKESQRVIFLAFVQRLLQSGYYTDISYLLLLSLSLKIVGQFVPLSLKVIGLCLSSFVLLSPKMVPQFVPIHHVSVD